ncbi:helix-turn-helix domain-containing protein [Streptomyces sp. 058-1L]|uniref:helix-turn-helix domain-containing protein n=1 Tax=Streptomyces sp. 058-1L TaxID=2789266 RepID=UPI00397E91B3
MSTSRTPPRITDLVSATGLSSPTAGRALDHLRRVGLVEFTATAPSPRMGPVGPAGPAQGGDRACRGRRHRS